MKLTTLFRLRKPDGTDPVNIEDFNDNFDVIDEELGKRLESTGNASDMTTAFTQASTRTNLKTGEKISASFGKIMKWFADLKAVAFSGSYNDLSNKPSIPSGAAASQAVANNCTTTAAGSVLDARQGKVLMDKTNQLSSELYAPVSGTGAMSVAQAVTHICENFVGRQRSARGRFACADFIGGFDIISDESGNCSGTIVSESETLSYSFFRRAGADAVLKKLGDGEFLAAVPYNTSRTPNGTPIPFDLSAYSGEVIIAFAFIWAYGVSLGITEITFSPEPEEYLYKAPDAYTMGGSWGYNVPFVIRINVDQIPNKTLYVNHKSNGQMRGCQYFIFQV